MRYPTALFVAICSIGVHGQDCSATVPNTAVVVNATGIVTNSDTILWVCSNIGGQLAGSGNLILIEPGGLWNLVGNDNTVYLAGNVYLTMSGNNNVIHLTISSDAIPGAGIGNTVNMCTTMTFDRTDAPAGGCFPASMVESDAAMLIQLSPVPASGHLQVHAPNGQAFRSLRVLDTSGRRVYDVQTPTNALTIDVSPWPTGPYVVEVLTNNGIFRRTWLKE